MKSLRWWYSGDTSAELLQDDAGKYHFRLNSVTMPLWCWNERAVGEHATETTNLWYLKSWLSEASTNYYKNHSGVLVSVKGRYYRACLYRNPEGILMFSYGCEAYPLQKWNDELVRKLVERWVGPEERGSHTYDIGLALLLARKHAALEVSR
jgi:hypothetical protein